jgi:hypothetical protein
MPEERVPKLLMEWTSEQRRKRGRPRKTWMEGAQAAMTNKKFRTRSVEKQGGMAFGFTKMATAVIKPARYIDNFVTMRSQVSTNSVIYSGNYEKGFKMTIS